MRNLPTAICLFVFYLFVVWLMMLFPAHAADYSTVLLDLRGDPIVDELAHGPRDLETGKFTPARSCTMTEFKIKPSNCDVLTLGGAAANVLLANDPDNSSLDEKEKRRRGNLADRLFHGGKIDLGPEDIVLIKRLITRMYGNLVVSRALPLLDPSVAEK